MAPEQESVHEITNEQAKLNGKQFPHVGNFFLQVACRTAFRVDEQRCSAIAIVGFERAGGGGA